MSQRTVFDRNPTLARPGGTAERAKNFAPVLSELRDTIRASTPQRIAQLSGAEWDADAEALRLAFLTEPYRITWPDLVAYGASAPCANHLQGILLYYLSLADGADPTGQWVSFRELPEGWLYQQAFQSYTGKVLAPALDNDASALARAAATLDGKPLDLGDAGYEFTALPKVRLAIVYWLGDEEFDAEARVLFDASASHYLTTDGLAIVGSHLVQHLLRQL